MLHLLLEKEKKKRTLYVLESYFIPAILQKTALPRVHFLKSFLNVSRSVIEKINNLWDWRKNLVRDNTGCYSSINSQKNINGEIHLVKNSEKKFRKFSKMNYSTETMAESAKYILAVSLSITHLTLNISLDHWNVTHVNHQNKNHMYHD